MKAIITFSLLFFSIIVFLLIALTIFLWPLRYSQQPLLSKASISQESVKRLEGHVAFFTSITPPRNYKNITSLNKASEYIQSEFNSLSCKVTIQEFQIDTNTYHNVSCLFPSENINNPRIVIGAHYDVAGFSPGADDNASGVAGLLELGHLLDRNTDKINQPIELVVYTLEEPPYFRTEYMGSFYHARSLVKEGVDTDYMIVFEMIGYYSEEEYSQHYPVPGISFVYPSTGNFVALIGRFSDYSLLSQTRKSLSSYMHTPVYAAALPRALPGVDFSDHQNYWDNNINAIMITDTAFNRNPNYHKTTDTTHTLNYEIMADIVQGVYMLITEETK